MKAFVALIDALAGSRATSPAATTLSQATVLQEYLRTADERSASWGLSLLMPKWKNRRVITGRVLRESVMHRTGYPEWLVRQCLRTVGDASETYALLVPEQLSASTPRLCDVMEDALPALATENGEVRAASLNAIWNRLNRDERIIFHRLVCGVFRIRAGRAALISALAAHLDVAEHVIATRLDSMKSWDGDLIATLRALGQGRQEAIRPYRFAMIAPQREEFEMMGAVEEWLFQRCVAGTRAQVVMRGNSFAVWTPDLKRMNGEPLKAIEQMTRSLGNGVVMDGILVGCENATHSVAPGAKWAAWRDTDQLSLFDFDSRLNAVPQFRFVAFDLLELDGRDLSTCTTRERWTLLCGLLGESLNETVISAAAVSEPSSWSAMVAMLDSAVSHESEATGWIARHNEAILDSETNEWRRLTGRPRQAVCVLTYVNGSLKDLRMGKVIGGLGVQSGDHVVTIGNAVLRVNRNDHRLLAAAIRECQTRRAGPIRHLRPTITFDVSFAGLVRGRGEAGVRMVDPVVSGWRQQHSAERVSCLSDMNGGADINAAGNASVESRT